MIHADPAEAGGGVVQVAGLGARCLFLSFFSSPIRAEIVWVGVESFAFCPDLVFLRSFLLVSFIGIVACRPRGSGIRYSLINK